jgi:homoaconitase/3-isopropylmalate dehydratase large subunit
VGSKSHEATAASNLQISWGNAMAVAPGMARRAVMMDSGGEGRRKQDRGGIGAHAIRATDEEWDASAINRNYKGRSGPGKLWLASPLTVAASAFTGKITAYKPGMFAKMAAEKPVLV